MNAILRLFPRPQTMQRPQLAKQRRRRRLFCENLEDRRLLAVVIGSNEPILVTDTADDGAGTLRAAVALANAQDGVDTIQFELGDASPVITLTSGELLIEDDLLIDGLGASVLTISGNSSSRIFSVIEPADVPEQELYFDIFVDIEGLTLTDGSSDIGGAIYNEFASLTLTDVVLTGNSASEAGGAIFTRGDTEFNLDSVQTQTLIINDGEVSGNQAVNGGGIYNDFDHVEIHNTAVTGNTASGDGGGIFTLGQGGGGGDATLWVYDGSQVSGNSATGSGGGIYNENDHVELYRSTVTNNTAGIDGGGIYSTGGGEFIGETVYVRGSEISSNTAVGNGGGIYAAGEYVQIGRDFFSDGGSESVVVNNTAAQGGGIYLTTFDGEFGPRSYLDVYESTLSGNRAIGAAGVPSLGGGIFIQGSGAYIDGSTLDGNSAIGLDGSGNESSGDGWGGAIYQDDGGRFSDAFISGTTISNNVANGGTGGAEDGEGEGGGVWTSTSLNLSNVTLSGNSTNGNGGGVYVGDASPSEDVELRHVTVTDNLAADGGGLFHDSTSNVLLLNSLLAGNQGTNPDASGIIDVASTGNLIGDGTGLVGISDDDENGNQVGVLDPGLGELADNGGTTLTHALLAGSPAIDAGNNSYGAFRDQRGFRRFGIDDVGAYEVVLDFGDAPSSFPVLLESDGARHVAGGLVLGSAIDNEADGQPSAAGVADQDDSNGFPDDEDGVEFTFSSVAGFTGAANVTSTGDGFVNAWIDVDGSGTWEPSEQILTNAAVTAGLNVLTYNVPAAPGNPQSFTAVARFRLNSTGNLGTSGLAEDGEVEDYAMTINTVILPDGGGTGFTFTEIVPPRIRRSYDPEIAYGYDYVVNPHGDNFTEVELLSGFGDDEFTLEFEDTNGVPQSVTLTAPVIFNFETDAGIAGGVSEFRVLGIELSEGLDPDDFNAFPTGLAFGDADNDGNAIVDFTMTPLASPEAFDDDYEVDEDNVLSVPSVLFTGILDNDTDRNADPLTASLVGDVSNGTLALNADGSFEYTPDENYNGTDSFTYVANDGFVDSDPAIVTIVVNPVNDQPLADNGSAVTDQDVNVDVDLLPLVSDVETADDDLIYNLGAAIGGTFAPTAVNGVVTFTPDAGFTGDATLSFTVTDNGDPVGTVGDELTSDEASLTVTVNPIATGVSFVDANNNGIFDDGDVALVAGELDDGQFDTRKREGGYTSRIRGAGLVINGSPISAPSVRFLADGDLVINTDVTSTGPEARSSRRGGHRHSSGGGDIVIWSRFGSVELGDADLTSFGDIQVTALLDIIATDDSLTAAGSRSEVKLRAGREIDLARSVIDAGRDVDVAALSDVNVDFATLNGGREIELKSVFGDTSADGALLVAVREVELRAYQGTVSVQGSFVNATSNHGEVELKGGVVDIGVLASTSNPTVIFGAKEVEIRAFDRILADNALLQSRLGEVELDARNDISLKEADIRALKDIEVTSSRGNVDLIMADLGIIGGTKGDIEIKGKKLFIEEALLTAPDKIKLKGERIGDATLVKGTTPL